MGDSPTAFASRSGKALAYRSGRSDIVHAIYGATFGCSQERTGRHANKPVNRWSAHPKCLVILLIVPIYSSIYSHDLHVTPPSRTNAGRDLTLIQPQRQASRSRSSQGLLPGVPY